MRTESSLTSVVLMWFSCGFRSFYESLSALNELCEKVILTELIRQSNSSRMEQCDLFIV